MIVQSELRIREEDNPLSYHFISLPYPCHVYMCSVPHANFQLHEEDVPFVKSIEQFAK